MIQSKRADHKQITNQTYVLIIARRVDTVNRKETYMASLNMNGPYLLTNDEINDKVTRTSAGNYALGYVNEEKNLSFSMWTEPIVM